MFVGGNRSGKSTCGAGVISRFVRREGPLYARIVEPENRIIRVWAAPQTDEKAKSLWEPLLRKQLQQMEGYSYVQAPHRVFRWEDERGGGELWLKSQEQGFDSFESDDVDLVLFDEEPVDRRVYASARTRLSTTNGTVLLTFTPLKGMTWTYDELYAPVAKHEEFSIGDRAWQKDDEILIVQAGMADNPAAIKGGGVRRILSDASMTESEKRARLYGDYGYTEGLLIPQFSSLTNDAESVYLIDKLPEDRGYYWVLTADPNKRHGALLTALDSDGNRYYCAEHFGENLPDTEHALAYDVMLKEFNLKREDVDVYVDPGGAGAQAMINLAEVGYFGSPVPKDPASVSASIKRLRRHAHPSPKHKHPITGLAPAPHVYFLRTLNSQWKSGGVWHDESRLMWEFRQYRQAENKNPDTPIKRNDDLVDCARYVELAHPDGPAAPWLDPVKKAREKLDPASKMEAEQFDEIISKVMKEKSWLPM